MYHLVKRALDIAVASATLLFLLPLIGVVAIAIRISLGEPAIFLQRRIGLRERPFTLLKFRSMRNELDSGGHLLPDAARLSRFGKVLRKTSFDEVPQLWNVLRGDMTLVGPRPLLPQYLPRYSSHQRRRHEVKPGITGWAQVKGRNALTWEQKFDLDVWYVDHRSTLLDVKILFLTFAKVLRRDGILQPGHATMPEFMGREGN